MSRFDEDTSTMRMRIEATPIELRKAEKDGIVDVRFRSG